MSHAADGELHAWLDGALEHEAPDRAARIVAHLKSCRDCRARLEEARELRDRAEELLSAAGPAGGILPPFEELEERAGSGRGSDGSGMRGRPGTGRRAAGALRILAWAASLVLGFGVGWAARATLHAGGDAGVVAVAERPSAFESARAEREDRVVDATEGGATAEPTATPPVSAAERRLRAAGNETKEEGAKAGIGPEITELADAGEPVGQAGEREEREGAAQEEFALQETRVRVEAPPVADLRAAATPDEQYREADATTVWIAADEEDAARWIGGRLFEVEGLAVVDLAVSTADGARVARLRQRLPSGRLLEVHQRPDRGHVEDADAAAADPPATLGGLEVRLRGPVASDSLRALLSRLRPRRP